MAKQQVVYTEAEAAKILDIKLRTLQKWRMAGRIGHLRLSKRFIRYRDSDLRSFIKGIDRKPAKG
jgi:predicted site-specific integrase-resolvase